MTDVGDKLHDLRLEFVQFKTELTSAIKLTRFLVAGIAVVLFVFFGVSYAKLDGIVQETVEGLIKNETIQQASEAAKKASQESIRRSDEFSQHAKQKATEVEAALEETQSQIRTAIPAIHDVMAKLNGYEPTAKKGVAAIEAELSAIQSKIPNLYELSVAGIAKDGDKITAPSGSLADWNIIISPRYIGFSDTGIGENTILLSARYRVDPIGEREWKVSALSHHKFGNSVTTNSGEVYYVLFPKGTGTRRP